MTNDNIQTLAEELSRLDYTKDSERIRNIESEICMYEIGLLKNVGGKAYFPLLGGLNVSIPFDDFYNIFIDVLLGILKNYNPDKGKFITALMFIIRNRIKDYFSKIKKKSDNEESYEARLETFGEAGEIPDKEDFTDKFVLPKSEFELFCCIAPLVALRKEQEEHLPKSKKSYFEGFFTFDTTAQTKKGLFDKIEVIAQNESLFPILEIVILEYLLVGTLTHMRDVANNEIKDMQRLNQRNETMQVCYNISKPTVVDRNRLYRQLWEAINN